MDEKHNEQKSEFLLSEIQEHYPNLQNPDKLLTELQDPGFKALGELSTKLGAEFYLEGGTVRDSLLGLEATDFDFVVTFPVNEKNADLKSKEDVINAFEDFFGQKEWPNGPDKGWIIRGPYGTFKLTGEKFGVYQFRPKNSDIDIDISLPRTEFSSEEGLGGAKNMHVQSDPRLSFEDEVQRRDFTVNGMGIKLQFEEDRVDGQLCDYVNGLEDLNNRLLRAIGNPYERLSESLDRIPRGIRFAAAKGLEIEEQTKQAMTDITDGKYPEGSIPSFIRKYPSGKAVMGRDNLGKNLAQSLAGNAAETLDIIEEIHATHYLFKQWTEFSPPNSFPKGMDRELLTKLRAEPLETANDYRERYYAVAKASIAEHLKHNPKASIDEIMFLLSLDLGKCASTQSGSDGDRRFYAAETYSLSSIYLSEMMRQNGLETLPSDSKYRVDKAQVNKWLGNWQTVIGMLSVPDRLNINGATVRKLADMFPDFQKDPYWHLVRSYITVSPDAEKAKTTLDAFEQVLTKAEELQKTLPFEERTLLNGSNLVESFFVKQGPLVRPLMEATYNKYVEACFRSGDPSEIKVDQAKIGIFLELSQHSRIRDEWKAMIDSDTLELFSGKEDKAEDTRRSILRFMEKKAFQSYMGKPMEACLDDPTFAEAYKKRYARREVKHDERLQFLDIFAERLADNPDAMLDWLEQGFKRKDSLASMLFPELKALKGCEQPSIYHSEGDAWTHTRLLFKKADELGIELTPELALILLYHDSGKPDAREEKVDEAGVQKVTFLGHARAGRLHFENFASAGKLGNSKIDIHDATRVIDTHMDFLDDNSRVGPFAVKEAFPKGTDDNLYLLMRCDTAASISENPRDDSIIFAPIEKWGRAIAIESKLDPTYFDTEIMQIPVISELVSKSGNSKTAEKIYGMYLTALESTGKLPTANEILKEFITADINNALIYVSRVSWPARQVIEELGITPDQLKSRGKEIGDFQRQKAQELIDNVK